MLVPVTLSTHIIRGERSRLLQLRIPFAGHFRFNGPFEGVLEVFQFLTCLECVCENGRDEDIGRRGGGVGRAKSKCGKSEGVKKNKDKVKVKKEICVGRGWLWPAASTKGP